MKKVIFVSIIVCFSLISCNSNINNAKIMEQEKEVVFKPFVSFEKADERAKTLVTKFTLDQKIAFIKGYEVFFFRPIPELDIPLVYLTDASQGIHIRSSGDRYVNLDSLFKQPKKSTAFPPTLQLTATFNNQLAHDYAEAIGEECRASGIHVLLGPAMNIYRNSQCGRNFEYLGEDPFLASQMVKNYVIGLQNTGTMATIKHFIANQAEYQRRKSNSILSERAMNEIYIPAFKAGIDAGAQGLMTAYNLVNGEWAGESKTLITDILRGQLGYKGLVMSDWNSVYNTENIINSGQNIEMPLGTHINNVKELITEGKIKETQLDEMILPIIRSCIVMGFYDRDQKDEKYLTEDYYKKHSAIALQTAKEGIVLLKNKDHALPIKNTKNILVTGKYVNNVAKGLGSGEVVGFNTITLKQALDTEFGNVLTYVENPTEDELTNADQIILSVGMNDGESFDRPFHLKTEEEAFVQKVLTANKNTIVVVNVGSAIKMSNWDRAAAIVWAWYPGQIGNVALAEVLSGKVNPSGKLPMTIEKQFEDSPAFGYLPKGVKLGYERIDKSKRPKFEGTYNIEYKEDILVGYRWYDTKNIEPLYPFGHGLSYTSFAYSNLKITKEDEKVVVTFTVKNTGDVSGIEVAQVYVQDNETSIMRPLKELKGYQRIALDKGMEQETTITLDKQAFSFWHPTTKEWTLEKGEFTLLIGSSSRDIRLTENLLW